MSSWFPRFSPDGTRITFEKPGEWQNQWLDDREIHHNGTHLVIDGVETNLPAGNLLAAGGGRWASFVAAWPYTTYRSWDVPLLGAGSPAINPKGEFAYTDDYAAATKALICRGVTIAHGAITDVRMSRQAIVWSNNGRTWGYWLEGFGDVPADITVAAAEFRPIPIDSSDGPWVLTHTHTGFIVRPLDEFMGYRFDNGGQTFNPDGFIRDGILRVIFTDAHGEFDEKTFALTDPRVDLSAPLAVSIPRINRPLYLGWFTFGAAPDIPANCRQIAGQPFLCANDGTVLAQYVAAEADGTFAGLERAIATARATHPGVPVIAYWPRGMHLAERNKPGPIPSADLVGVEAYCAVNETPHALEDRLTETIMRCPRVALIAQGYTQRDPTPQTKDLAPLVPVYARLARDHSNIDLVLVFSAGSREGGWSDHLEIHTPWIELAAGITGTPPILSPPIVVPPPPKEPHVPQVPDSTKVDNDEAIALFRQLEAAYRANPRNAQTMRDVPTAPNGEWGFFQAQRFFGPERWDAARMLADVAKEVP